MSALRFRVRASMWACARHPDHLDGRGAPPVDRGQVGLGHHPGGDQDHFRHAVDVIVLQGGGQDVGLVVGHVLPDPADDRGVGHPHAPLRGGPVEHPLEGQPFGAAGQALFDEQIETDLDEEFLQFVSTHSDNSMRGSPPRGPFRHDRRHPGRPGGHT